MMTGCVACWLKNGRQWQAPVLFGGMRLTLSRSPFQKTFFFFFFKCRLAFLSSHSRLTGTTMSRQMKSRKRERDRERERGTKRKRDGGFTLLVLLASLCQEGRVTREQKRGERRETKRGEWYLESENRRERKTGWDGWKDGGRKWYLCSH